MQATHSAALTALKKELTWVKRQLTDRDTDPKRLAAHAQDVTVGCLHILAESPTLDLAGWVDRKPARKPRPRAVDFRTAHTLRGIAQF